MEMDQLSKRQSRALEIFEAKSVLQSLTKRIFCAFAIFGALYIGFEAFFIYNQDSQQINESNRKVLSGQMPLFIQYQDRAPICVDSECGSSIHDIILLAAEQLALDPDTLILSYHGEKLSRAAAIADSGVSSECTLEITEDPLHQYLFHELGDLSKCIDFCLTADFNAQTLIYVETRSDDKESDAPRRGELQMSQTDVISFEEFQDKVNKYVTNRGMVKKSSGVDDNDIEQRANYGIKELFVEINGERWLDKSHVRNDFKVLSYAEKVLVANLDREDSGYTKEIGSNDNDGNETCKYRWAQECHKFLD